MPIYEYQCRTCEYAFDALQKMRDEPLLDCPECGKPELRKLLSAPKFRLKGKGWYETDFKTGDKRNLHGENAKKSDHKKNDKAPDKKDSTKTDTAKKSAEA